MNFSIIIPTRNRSNLLRLAIISSLKQKNISFEVIVSDNCSTDNTPKVVKEFKDSRIKYIRNKKNIGYGLNIIQLFKKAKGDYIFTLGDDDFILDENTLCKSLKLMDKYKVGLAKIGTISYESVPEDPYQISILSEKLMVIKPGKNKKIILKSNDFGLGFISGLIFNNSLIDKKKIVEHAYPYFPMAFDVILKHGIAYIPGLFIVAKLSVNPEHMKWYLSVDKSGHFYIEDILRFVKDCTDDEEYKEYKRNFMHSLVIMMPSYRYFTSIDNYLKVLHKAIILDKSLVFYPPFMAYALVGFLPNFLIRFGRRILINRSKGKIRSTVRKYDYFRKIENLEIWSN